MGLRETIVQRELVVNQDIPGIGAIKIRRLRTRELLALPDERHRLAMVAAAVQYEDGTKVFTDVEAVLDMDWGIVKALSEAVKQANSVDVEKMIGDAEKK